MFLPEASGATNHQCLPIRAVAAGALLGWGEGGAEKRAAGQARADKSTVAPRLWTSQPPDAAVFSGPSARCGGDVGCWGERKGRCPSMSGVKG